MTSEKEKNKNTLLTADENEKKSLIQQWNHIPV